MWQLSHFDTVALRFQQNPNPYQAKRALSKRIKGALRPPTALSALDSKTGQVPSIGGQEKYAGLWDVFVCRDAKNNQVSPALRQAQPLCGFRNANRQTRTRTAATRRRNPNALRSICSLSQMVRVNPACPQLNNSSCLHTMSNPIPPKLCFTVSMSKNVLKLTDLAYNVACPPRTRELDTPAEQLSPDLLNGVRLQKKMHSSLC